MCWGPEHRRDIREAQEEIRLLFERYRGEPEPPVEPLDGEEEDAPEREREYTLSSAT